MKKRTIAMLPLAEIGHLNAAIALGRQLARAGYEIEYLGDPRDAGVFARCGAAMVALARQDTPFGPTYAWAACRAELVLVDTILIRPIVDACNAGKRVIAISTTFPLAYDPDTPPVTLGAGGDARAGWRAVAADHARIQDPHPHVGRRTSTLEIMRGFMRDRGWPDERWDARAAINPVARVPELVLAPAQLELPRRAVAERRYAGACVWLERDEPAHARAGDRRPLVYCAFGSQSELYPLSRLLAIVLAAARELPELRVVVAGVRDVPAAPADNVRCVAHAPQLAVLREAALMISHGGLNSVKEALCCGVPLIVLPHVADQPGNAARIALHRLGAAATWDGMTPAKLAALIRTVLGDGDTVARVQALGAALRAELAGTLAVEALEALL